MAKILTWLISSIVAGVLYRLGGWGKPFNTKVRDFGVPLVGVGLLSYLYPHPTWKILLSYFLTFGIYFGSLTTYWKKSGEDAKWYHWLLVGFGYSLAFLPFAFFSQLWLGFVLRCVICSVATMIWSEKIGEVNLEEGGRGFISTITIPLLIINFS